MRLTDLTVRNAKPTDKAYKLADEKSMFLLVNSNGTKWWRLKYRFAGKEKVLALGVYPEVSLAEACQKKDDARRLLAKMWIRIALKSKREERPKLLLQIALKM